MCELFTGRNPCRRVENINDPVVLDPIGNIPGSLSGLIADLLRRMLEMDPTRREEARELMDDWSGAFENAVKRAHELEGRVF